jgi:Ca-activated chloride channel homolog
VRRIACAVFLLWAAATWADAGWDSLWRTADQRGQELLRQGKAAEAARTFTDPRRRAYAELQAGDYRAAAHDFGGLDDSDAHYNRGNALAHAGNLKDALQAYDAALARDPNNQDARQNRDLVQRALKQQQPPQQPSSGKDQSGNKQNGEKKDQGGQGQQSSPSKGKSEDSSAGQSNTTAQNGKGKGNNKGQQTRAGKPAGVNPAASQASNRPDRGNMGQGASPSEPAPRDDAEQARRDAAAGLERQGLQGGRKGDGAGAAAGQTGGSNSQSQREQQLTQEQWLRLIPDDPGGLLRRKFMIEHLMRQQGGQP